MAKLPHPGGEMRVFYPGFQAAELAAGWRYTAVQVLVPDCVPLFLTDGFKEYKTAILAHFGYWMQPERVLWYFPECKIAIISTSYAYMSMSQNVEKSVK
jgi:hypothetical protein